jgi:hypothetical protein
MTTRFRLLAGWLILIAQLYADDVPVDDVAFVREVLARPILPVDTPLMEVRAFCERRVPDVPQVGSAEEWTRLTAELRERAKEEVVFRGEAAAWREMPTEVEWFDEIDAPDYRIRKLRFEAVPGLWIPALLYEPKNLSGQVPVALAVNGHDGAGKAADYKQIRCINLAKKGIIALNLEWVGMGQLRGDDFNHYRMNQLDLVGTSGLAPFYLSMQRGLDILLAHEHADPTRVAVSGLSGGGWQTICISGLDERVTLANPVAGYSSFKTRAQVTSDLGDSEQTPSDLATVVDYAHLTAMRAPHPLLLTNNDRDRCCFAAGHALPPLLAATRPVYALYGAQDKLWAHINHVPGTHNYERDNREALYRIIAAHWYPEGAFDPTEIDCASEVRSAEELAVPIPDGNAGFNTLAMALCDRLPALPAGQAANDPAGTDPVRSWLAQVAHVSDTPVTQRVEQAVEQTGIAGVTTKAIVFTIGNEWSVPAVEFVPEQADRIVVVVCDGGRTAAADQIAELVRRGSRVVAVDPFYFGESRISTHDFLYALLVAAVGERPLGIQAGQLRAVCRSLHEESPDTPLELKAIGRRTGLAALIAAAIETEAIDSVDITGGFDSLKQVLSENLPVNEAPELFCFGLLKEFDIPQIEALVAPRSVWHHEIPSEPTPAQ